MPGRQVVPVQPPERRNGPLPKGAVSEPDTNHSSSSLPSISPVDDVARYIDGAFVVMVEVTRGKYRRRCYLTLKAAENAARRATARGETATVYLSELKPLWKVRAGEPA